MEKRSILNLIEEDFQDVADDIVYVDGYNDAIIGVTDDGEMVYSKEKMVDITVKNENMTEDEAWEFLEFNCFNAYLGPFTPIFVNTYSK